MERPSFSNARSWGELLLMGSEALKSTSPSARLDSEVLLGHLLRFSRTELVLRATESCDSAVVSRFEALIERRGRGEPVAYITGEREFWGLSFQVLPAVLVPRPESELIVEEALAVVGSAPSVRFIDLGVGSGCLSISLTVELKKRGCNIQCVGVDISEEALKVAKANAQRHGVENQVTYVNGNWFDGVKDFQAPFDLIVANPPYIDPGEQVPVELSFEPRDALFSGEQGLKAAKDIIEGSISMLRSGGCLLVEVGAGKRALLGSMLLSFEEQYQVSLLGDSSPDDRFTVIKLIKR